MAIDTLDKIPILYHFTDRRNLPLIRSHGLCSIAELNRRRVTVPAPGGNQWSRDADDLKGMGEYVHLCFRNQHTMEFVARQEGRINDSIFLQINPAVLKFPGVKFTSDVSNKAGVQAVLIAAAQALIDWEILYTRTDWADPDVQRRLKQAEKYEILVPKHIPLSHIRIMDNG